MRTCINGLQIFWQITQEQESLRVNNYLINYAGPSLRIIKHVKYIHLGWWSSDIQLITKYDKGVRFLLCEIDIYSK